MSDRKNPDPLHAEVRDRFGVLPNFFRLGPEAPAITENLWGFAKFGYLDNPLPPLFKERLFVYLSRFCEVRYCIARHVGFLVGLGQPAGDRQSQPETVEQIVRLLRRQLPRGDELEPFLADLEGATSPLAAMPDPDMPSEEAIFACATHVFLQTPQASRCLEALRGVFDGALFQHLLVFLTFVRTAHFWTKLHPELQMEEDITNLLAVHEALAECVANDPEASSCDTTQSLIDELIMLRQERTLRLEVERASEALEERERQLRFVSDNAAVLIAQCDTEGRYKFVNRPYAARFGLEPRDVSGKHIADVVGEVAFSTFRNHVEQVLTGTPVQFEVEIPYSTGETQFMRCAYTPERDPRGKVVGLIAAIIDITDRKRAEENARESRSRLDSTLAASEIGTWEYDVANNKVWADQNLTRMFGVSPEEADGGPLESYLNVIHPEDRGRVVAIIGRAIETGEGYEADYRLAVSGAPLRWVIARGRVERDGAGMPLRLPGVVMDITGQRQAEAELRKTEERWRLALDSAELGAWHVDPATMTLTTDERFRAIFGVKEQRFDYEQAVAVIYPEDQARVREAVAEATRPENPTPYAIEYRVVHPNGSIRWIFAKGRANFERTDIGQKLVSFDGTVNDITARKEAEQERERLVHELQEQDRRKDEFLATLAHELRNPLAPIRNGLQVLRLGGATGEMADNARTMMERQLGHMVHLIDDLLDLSRISRGKIELRMERVELSKVIQHSVETSRPLIESSGHDLTITVPFGPIYVDADLTRLAQVFSNLLNNAAKYTERGGRVQLVVQQSGGDVFVSVEDNGVGIPAHMVPKVFEMFTQVDRHLERSQGGLGIGLSIVKRLVEMHGGSVGVESDGPGQGSKFIVRLPVVLSMAQTTDDDEEPSHPSSRRRILVVDDNVDAAMSLAMMLKLMGNEAKTAHDGLEAMEVAATYRPDLILLDIGMPRLNGYETAQRIREQPWGKKVALVALTGWGQDEDRTKSEQAGFDWHIVKPVEIAVLEKLLVNLKANTA
jgi:PAS domain S-box-containing protein